MNIRISDIFIQRFAPPDAVRRGRELYLKDSVRLVRVDPDGILAEVHASKLVTVALRRSGHQFEVTCSCGIREGRCEHGTAVLYEIQHRQGSHGELTIDGP